jgi:hypothetical protein
MVCAICSILLFATLLIISNGVSLPGSNRKIIKREYSGDSENEKTMLPKAAPHEDSCYLLEFHTDNNDMCEQMEPVIERLEADLGTKVRRINIFRRREFMGLLEAIGFDECGSIPFYYNRRTGQAVCGATSYLNLKRWGTGDLNHLFQDPPENVYEQEPDFVSSRRDVGFKGFFTEKMRSLENKGKEKAERETARKSSQKKAKTEPEKISKVEAEEMNAADRTAARRLARKSKKTTSQ